MKLAFIGLGVMGFPMAAHLQSAGHQVCVFNRTTKKAEKWCRQHGGERADTPAEASKEADIAFLCVGNDQDVRQVVLGEEGILQGIGKSGIIVDHTTASAAIAQEISEAAASKAVGFLDAPLSGGQIGAESGQLTIMVGGEPETFTKVQLVMDAYAKAITHIGPVGSGQLAKMVNQICIAGVVQGLSEALHFAKSADLDIPKVIEAISKGAAQSWQMENRWQNMVDNSFEFGFAVEWMRKDLKMALQAAEQNGAILEMTKLVDGYYKEVEELGGSRWDTSSLIARLENK
jgi:3-hydroxyisobutyrate dehydrogenase-like beta-hydroxyacid dehydrogenase